MTCEEFVKTCEISASNTSHDKYLALYRHTQECPDCEKLMMEGTKRFLSSASKERVSKVLDDVIENCTKEYLR